VNSLKERWQNLSPEQKRNVVILLILSVIVIVGYFGYKSTRAERREVKQVEQKKDITLDAKLLQKSLYHESQKELELLKKQIEALKKEKEQQNQELLKKIKEMDSREEKRVDTKTPEVYPEKKMPLPPPPPPMSTYTKDKEGKQTPVFIGEIAVVSNTESTEVKPEVKQDDKKKETETVYLPPSFMEATLLSGLDAPAMGDAQKNPVPALLRVKDIAVLPNRVKANLKGCFVIADGVGSLADERAHMRLVSLSCIAKNGQAVIDQKVKGFIVDSDGKIGLRGKVVSKMGSAIARSFLAGLFGGIGEAIRASTVTTSVSALGTTQTVSDNYSDIAKAGVGSGLASSAQQLQKFYLKLAEQAIPVIEVGATRNVTLVISEGVELKIKETCIGGRKCKDS